MKRVSHPCDEASTRAMTLRFIDQLFAAYEVWTGDEAMIEATIRRVLAEHDEQAQADLRRLLHD